MISLVLIMVRARRWQALTLALLAMLAVAASVAAPAYLRAVDRAVVAGEVAAASPPERGITVSTILDDRAMPTDVNFTDVAAALIALPGFTEVSASEYSVVGLDRDPHKSSRLTFRQDVCAHLVMRSGRCLIGEGEVIVGADQASQQNLVVGSPIDLTFASLSTDPRTPWYLPDGLAKTMTVVGVFSPSAPDDPYWGSHGYFAVDATGAPTEPVFTSAATQAQMDHGKTVVSIDAIPGPSVYTVDNLRTLSTDLNRLNASVANLGPGTDVSTSIYALLVRIDKDRSLAHQTVPVAAVPLILLAYFVIFLAAGHEVDGRRRELAVVALRGARWWVRWWLALGESMVAIVVGAVLGCLAGQLLGGVLIDGPVRLLDPASLRYAPIAAAGAVLAAVAAQWRRAYSTVVDLLRQIPSRARGWRLAAGEAICALLAVVAAIQLWTTHGSLIGVGMFAPALVIAALAMIASHAVLPLASRIGRVALRRGRLGGALGALDLARRPGARQLFVLLAGAVAVLSFAACALDVAGQDRDIAARVGTGAPRVLSVADVTRQQLLHAVRTVDPDGSYAMAVAQLPSGRPGETPKLAIDSAALPTTALWRNDFGPLSAADVARLLRPTAPDPVVVPGQDVTLDLDVSGADVSTPISLTVVLSPIARPGTVTIPFGVLHNGPYTYQQRAGDCLSGCRLVGFHFTTDGTAATSFRISVTLRDLRTVNPDQVAASATDLSTVARWRIPAGGSLTSVPQGLRADFNAPDGIAGGGWIQPADAPYPLPVVSTAALPPGGSMAGLDGRPTPVAVAGRVSALPRLGTSGTLMDLEYADRLSTDAGMAVSPQVWLGPAAPSNVVARLTGQGLIVTSDVRVDTARTRLAEQGPALALRFYLLVGVLAIVLAAGGLALVATVERRDRAAELAALRAQGLRRGTVRRTLVWGYPALAIAAGLIGLLTALVAWRVTGWALPVFTDEQTALALPVWPRPLAVVVPWLGAVAVLAVVGLVISQDLRRLVAQQLRRANSH